MQCHVVAQKFVDELVLLWHLHQAVSLFPHSANSAKNGDFWLNTRVFLSPKIDYVVGKANSSACASYSSRTVNNYFFFFLRGQNHQNKVLKHKLERRHRVTRRYSMIWPSCVVKLLHQLVFNPSCFITDREVSGG